MKILMIGKCLGDRYEILEQLGGGGMSLVYKAKDKFLNRLVTVKVLRSVYTSDDDFVHRFHREARAVASLSHPNIVNIHDIGQQDEIHYLVMEYIDGNNLKNFMQKNKEMCFREVANIIGQICDALQHAHDNNIVHRDVKPHNILITNDSRVKLTDFGIAIETTSGTITNDDMVMGSVHYISPEQVKGEVATFSSDIYSLGVILYEMLTGKLPFTGDTPIAVALKHVQEEPERPFKINPSIPEELEQVVMKAMEKDPQKRYESAKKLKEELEAAVAKTSDKFVVTNDFSTKILPAANKEMNEKEETQNDDKNSKKVIKRTKIIKIALMIFSIVLSIVSGVALAFFKYLDVREVEVPDVVGMLAYNAVVILKENGLGADIIEVHDDTEKGKVIRQKPEAGVLIKEGRNVELVVSLGPKLVKLPDVRGDYLSDARISLHNAGFKYTIKEIFSEKPAGVVLDQKPLGGKHPVNTEVELTVSKGPKLVVHKMPDLIGLTIEEARSKLIGLNLLLDEPPDEEPSKKFLRGMIMEQNPAPGEDITEGSAVSVVVSKGPGPPLNSARVEILLEDDLENPKVRITVTDIRGEHDVYLAVHSPGEVVVRTVDYYSPAVIRVYINDVLKQEKHL